MSKVNLFCFSPEGLQEEMPKLDWFELTYCEEGAIS